MGKDSQSHHLRELIRLMERKLGLLGKSEVSCCGVTPAQCHAVVEIGRATEISLTELAEIIGLDCSTLSRTVDNLVKKNYAKRGTAPGDRRSVTIKLTDKGISLFEKIESNMEIYYRKVFDSIPVKKQPQILESLELVLDALDKNRCCE